MKYIIRKAEYISGEERRSELMTLEVDDIESKRKEFKELMHCDRVHFTYDMNEKFNINVA